MITITSTHDAPLQFNVHVAGVAADVDDGHGFATYYGIMRRSFEGSTMIAFLKRYWRRIAVGLLFGWALLPLTQLLRPGAVGRGSAVIEAAINLVLVASQTFWISRAGALGAKIVTGRTWRVALGSIGLVIYIVLLTYNLQNWENVSKGSTFSVRAALLEAPMRVWLFGSLLGFLLIAGLWCFDRVLRTIAWVYRKVRKESGPGLLSPDRRHFLEQTAIGCAAAPFIAGAYGLFYARLNLQTTHRRITLRRLPSAFEGFRIVQLSDLHISAFMTADQIRRFAGVANDLKPDLVALTGDFLTWDESAQRAVVEALSILKAPFGVVGCLGNHEWLTRTEDSITRLFAVQGTRILRNERASIATGGSTISVLGVDYQSLRGRTEAPGHPVAQYLPGVEQLLAPDTMNILLSHNPNTFDRAAELGIDLSLSGHTHGGQVTLDFVDAHLSPAHVLTEYARGLFRRGDAQLYVNCGIGTIGFPIRLGAPPEITVIELTRQA